MSTQDSETEDVTGLSPYDIEGYEWEMKTGDEIEEGTLLPGHGCEVYEIQDEAGYSLNLEKQYYTSVMVDDGEYDFLPVWGQTRERDQFNDAMKERVDVHSFNDNKQYWTLTRADG